MSLLALLGKDARLLVRHRALLAALLLYPLLLGSVLGVAFREPPARLDLALVDHDAEGVLRTPTENLTTRDLIGAARGFADVRLVADRAAALSLLRTGGADAALVIPRGFLRNLSTLGSSASLELIVDESDPVRAGVARNAVRGGLEAFMDDVVRKKVADVQDLLNLTVQGGQTTVLFVSVDILGIDQALERLREVHDRLPQDGPDRAKVAEVIGFLEFTRNVLGNSERYLTTTAIPLQVESRGLTVRQAGLAAIALPGALVLGLFWTGALAAALLATRERETGVARRLATLPARPWVRALSKALVAACAALVPAFALLGFGVEGLDLPLRAPGLVAVVLVAASLAAVALGALAAALARNSSAAALLAVLGLLPMLLMGGLFYPVAYMPAGAQAVSRALPVTAATDALRGALLRGNSAIELAGPLASLLLFALLAAGAARLLTRGRAWSP